MSPNELNSVLARLQSSQYEKDQKIDALFSKLISDTELLESDELSSHKKYELVLANEYLLTRLRFLIADEMIKVEHGLSIEINETAVKAFYNKRKGYLAVVNQRLLEIREDLNVLSKITYNRF